LVFEKSQRVWLFHCQTPTGLDTRLADPKLHHNVIVSSHNARNEFESALRVELNGSLIIALHKQHKPLNVIAFALLLSRKTLRFVDQMGHDLNRVSPVSIFRLSMKPLGNAQHRNQDQSCVRSVG